MNIPLTTCTETIAKQFGFDKFPPELVTIIPDNPINMNPYDYQQQAKEALAQCDTTIKIKLSNTKTPTWDPQNQHNHYRVTLENSKGKYTFDFWGSQNDFENNEHPNEYDVLAALDFTVHETFKDFCSEFGYSTDSVQALNAFKRCNRQAVCLRKLFTPQQIELLQQIR